MTMTETEKPEVRAALEGPADVRCWRCKRVLAEKVSAPYKFTCNRCHARNDKA